MLRHERSPDIVVLIRREEMGCESVQISSASPSELSEILAQLTAVDLPHEGVAYHLSGFLVARVVKKEGSWGQSGLSVTAKWVY